MVAILAGRQDILRGIRRERYSYRRTCGREAHQGSRKLQGLMSFPRNVFYYAFALCTILNGND